MIPSSQIFDTRRRNLFGPASLRQTGQSFLHPTTVGCGWGGGGPPLTRPRAMVSGFRSPSALRLKKFSAKYPSVQENPDGDERGAVRPRRKTAGNSNDRRGIREPQGVWRGGRQRRSVAGCSPGSRENRTHKHGRGGMCVYYPSHACFNNLEGRDAICSGMPAITGTTPTQEGRFWVLAG